MALSRHHAALTRPLSVQEITTEAENFSFSVNHPLQQWIRAGRMLLTEAAICEQDSNLQMAYLYLLRHAELVISKLPQHPQYKDPKFKDDLAQTRKVLKRNMLKMEQLKPRINRKHQQYVEAMQRQAAERQRVDSQREPAGDHRSPTYSSQHHRTHSEDGAADDHDRALNASEHSEFAVDLAHREIRRRDQSRQMTTQAGISPGTVADRRKGIVLGPPDPANVIDGAKDDGVRAAGRYLDSGSQRSRNDTSVARDRTIAHSYNYPTVPQKEQDIDWRSPTLQADPTHSSRELPPTLPAKHVPPAQAPPVPARPHDPRGPSEPALPSSPPLAQSLPPTKYTFKPVAWTESGDPLRTVLLPADLRATFLDLADANTARNLETCAILCGTLISNALFINHLIVPDQRSTSDTCDTTEAGDNALFDYCDNADLLVCGWIHTHPSQTCFLSSRDLHTSSGYQIMLPEAIAIVCAPRHNPDWGIFRLTAPPGLQAVSDCKQQGLFHLHKESNLYTDALRPGHVVEAQGLKFEVVDLRRT